MSDETQRIELLHETKRNLNAGKIVFSRFELMRELGSGGMGVVWLAKDLEVEGRVALKFLPGLVRDPVAERDLRDEVKNARDLVHENIVSVRTLHKDDASIAVEMEYVDGPNVNALIANSPNRFLEVEEAKPIIRGLCLAIDHAWAPPRRLVHRDIKPHNLLVNSAHQVKVVDFGIAHTVSETITRLTGKSSGERERVVGTLPYMSPQQLKGEVHHSNDVYSIGATIYQMLTGVPPFRATDTVVLMKQIDNDVPVSMTERRRLLAAEGRRDIKNAQPIPKAWEDAVAACLAKNPAKRPATAREIALRLGLLAGSPAPRRVAAPLLVGTAVVLAAAAGGMWWMLNRPPVQSAPTVERPALARPVPSSEGETPVAPEPTPVRDNTASSATANPRGALRLTAAGVGTVTVSRVADEQVLFRGVMNTGDGQTLPLDTPLLIETKDAAALSLQIDGAPLAFPPVKSNRWVLTVPTAAERPTSLVEAPPPPPPFEKEVGPLVTAGAINQLESDWLRAALGGDKGEPERALARQLVSAGGGLTLGQWRAKTALKFKPDLAALRSLDPATLAHAIDLVLPPRGMELRLLRIEPGRFLRGSPADEIGRRPSDQPVTQVDMTKPYFIGVFEVTQAQYESVMLRSPSYWRGNPTWPVDQVTWKDLTSNNGFLARLNNELGKQFGGALVADLPTEDEWEYACRAGTDTAFNNGKAVLHIENDKGLELVAHYNKSEGGPRPVGSFEPNAWGLYDFHGNLQEWTLGRYVRGGSWNSKAANCRAASRAQMSGEAGASNQTGFRLVLRFKATEP